MLKGLLETQAKDALTRASLEAEQSSDLSTTISPADEARVNQLSRQLATEQQELLAASTARAARETERTALRNELSENLRRHEAQLSEQVRVEDGEGTAEDRLQIGTAKLGHVDQALGECTAKINSTKRKVA